MPRVGNGQCPDPCPCPLAMVRITFVKHGSDVWFMCLQCHATNKLLQQQI